MPYFGFFGCRSLQYNLWVQIKQKDTNQVPSQVGLKFVILLKKLNTWNGTSQLMVCKQNSLLNSYFHTFYSTDDNLRSNEATTKIFLW
jgi:hypothetical protein